MFLTKVEMINFEEEGDKLKPPKQKSNQLHEPPCHEPKTSSEESFMKNAPGVGFNNTEILGKRPRDTPSFILENSSKSIKRKQ